MVVVNVVEDEEAAPARGLPTSCADCCDRGVNASTSFQSGSPRKRLHGSNCAASRAAKLHVFTAATAASTLVSICGLASLARPAAAPAP